MTTRRNRGLAAERLERLREIARQRQIVSVAELQRMLGVSPATARRDLRELERRGEVRRVHGGAMHVGRSLAEPLFDSKETIAAAEKQRIARAARKLVKADDCIFLDGGSTVLALARLLADRADLTVATNSLRVAMALASRGPHTVLVGGELRRLSQTFVGPLTRFTIDQLHVDLAFVGTIGVDPAAGLTTTDPHEAYTKSLILRHARQAILLADGSKTGQVAFARFGGLEDIDILVTDRKMDARTAREFRKRKVRVIIARAHKGRTTCPTT